MLLSISERQMMLRNATGGSVDFGKNARRHVRTWNSEFNVTPLHDGRCANVDHAVRYQRITFCKREDELNLNACGGNVITL
jgi:hypothetical protein